MSDHFSEEELCHSSYAERHGIYNRPDKKSRENLERLAAQVLEPLRREVARPIYITSGYRSKEVNAAVGGSVSSQHMKGEAVDTVCPGIPIEVYFGKIMRMAAHGDIIVDQVILEFQSWVHISYKDTGNRNQFLKASKVNGRTVYTTVGYLKERPEDEGTDLSFSQWL